MPTNSVQLYVKSLLDGITMPGVTKQMAAFVTPPTVMNINAPVACVWGARLHGRRQTAPRIGNATLAGASGYHEFNWIVDVYLSYETVARNNTNGDTLDQEFPLVIDGVLNTLMVTEMPKVIQDPSTGQYSQILSIGEEFEMDYPPEKTPATLRMLYYTTRLGLIIKEAIQL